MFRATPKDLVNTVSSTMGIDRDKLRSALDQIGLEPTVRGEQLTMDKLAKLSDML